MKCQVIGAAALLCAFPPGAFAQKGPFDDDLKGLTSSGSVKENVYLNPYAGLRLRLPQPPCDAKLNTQVDAQRGHAIVLACVHYVQGMGGMYTLKLAFDYRVNYPSDRSVEEYVRRLRRSIEDSETKVVEPEKIRTIAGREFVQAILITRVPNATYYQGIACTHLKGWLLLYEVEAPTVEAVRALLDLRQKLEITDKKSAP